MSCEIHGLGIGVNKYSSTQVNLAATVLRMVWCVVLWVALFYYLSTIHEPSNQPTLPFNGELFRLPVGTATSTTLVSRLQGSPFTCRAAINGRPSFSPGGGNE